MSKKFNFGASDSARQHWGTISIAGSRYNLSHLNAHKVEYTDAVSGEAYECYVTYSHHCFAKTEVGYNDQPSFMYHHPTDPRHFHEQRYLLSFRLREIISSLPTRYVFHGGRAEHYCSSEYTDSEGAKKDYKVVFKVFRSIGKLRLHVSSAYLTDRGKTRKVGFMKILQAASQGRRLPGPQK